MKPMKPPKKIVRNVAVCVKDKATLEGLLGAWCRATLQRNFRHLRRHTPKGKQNLTPNDSKGVRRGEGGDRGPDPKNGVNHGK